MRIAPETPPGLNSDDTIYASPGVWETGSNVRFYRGKPEAIGSDRTQPYAGGSVTYTKARKLLAYKVSTALYVAVATDDNLYKTAADGSGWAKTDITPAAGWPVANTRHSLDMFGDILLACPATNTIFKSVAGAQAVSIANAPDNITKMIVVPSRQVMALGCNEEVSGTFNGRCIRWCDIEDFDDWTTSSSNNAGEYILSGQENIVSGCVLGQYIIVWTTGSIWLGQYLGEPGQTFQFTRIGTGGCIAQDAWATYKGVVYWMDPKYDVYAYQPGGVPTKIPCPIRRAFPSISAGTNEIHAFTRSRFGEIWFFIPRGSPTGVVYCVEESQASDMAVWWLTSLDAGAVIDDPLLYDVTGTNGMNTTTALRVPYNNNGTSSLVVTDMPYNNGTTDTNVTWSLTSSAFYVSEGEQRVMVKKFYKDFEQQSASVTLLLTAYDDPNGSSVGSSSNTIATSDTKADFRVSGKLMTIKYSGTGGAQSNDYGTVWRLGKPAFEIEILGQR
jgi:hypothetical protein